MTRVVRLDLHAEKDAISLKRITMISGNTSIWDMVNAGPATVTVAVDELVLVG